MSAFQGIEAFLYSILSHPKVNIKFFDKNETIGMRNALTQFQTYLQNTKIIKINEVIPYSNSLLRLAYLRDQVVHKCLSVLQSECMPIIEDSRKFASKYSTFIFGFDIFD